jgi:hypothetical protein
MADLLDIRVELTSKGWWYQALRNLRKARRCPNTDEAVALKERALDEMKRTVQPTSQRVGPRTS